MALVVKDRVRETSTSTGTGTITLNGAVAAFQSFAVIGNGNTTYYTIVDAVTGAWEVGIGTYTSSGTLLSRDTILESSNAGSAVDFAAGVKDVFCTYPAERSIYTDAAGSAITPATASALPAVSGGTGLTSPGTSGNVLTSNGTTWASSALPDVGDVDGPASATDNAVARYDGTTGKIIQNSAVTIADDGATVIDANTTSAALRITQVGTGNALLVEDSANPDATPTVIAADGTVIIGNTTSVPVWGFGNALQVWGAFGYTSQGRFTNDAFSARQTFVKSRSTSPGGFTVVQNNDQIGEVVFAGSDGTQFVQAALIQAAVDGTPGTNDMPGRLVFSTTADGASSPTERMRIDNAGRVGIGIAPTAAIPFYIANTPSGASAFGAVLSPTFASTVTTTGFGIQVAPSTAAASFTCSNLVSFYATQGSLGAGSSVTNQFGFIAESTFIGATNNFGFRSNIASGTGRWNFYAQGSAANFFAGNVGIGGINYAFSRGTTNVQSHGTSGGAVGFTAATWVNSATNNPNIVVAKSRGATVGSHVIVQNNDTIGQVNFEGSDGTKFLQTANIFSQVDGTPGTDDMPGRLVFGTTADGASTPTERMRIDNAGRVGIGIAAQTDSVVRVGGNFSSTSTSIYVNRTLGTLPSGVTSAAFIYEANWQTAAASYNLTNLIHFAAVSSFAPGAGSSITNEYGFYTESNVNRATNNYGFYSNIGTGVGRFNFYAAGSAANYFAGDMQLDKTVTAGGTTGAQTINKNAGTVNFAAAATSLVVTDSRVTTSSIIICTVGTNDTTLKSVAAVAGAGSFTLHASAAATAETRVNFLIIN